jgi:hypothetical protein
VSKKIAEPAFRFGIGEWYGRSFADLTAQERSEFATFKPNKRLRMSATKWAQLRRLSEKTNLRQSEKQKLESLTQAAAQERSANKLCPFKPADAGSPICNKEGGVCSLRAYHQGPDGRAVPVSGMDGALRVTCPERFKQANVAFKWAAESVLNDVDAVKAGEVPFLETAQSPGEDGGKAVGRIDMVMVSLTSSGGIRDWVPAEVQAVYFSGPKMSIEFSAIASDVAAGRDGLIWPTKVRRPDYRSSGPKRLMPQLQIKVPTLRRWGKKMAVVVDDAFFRFLGPMSEVDDASNADILWFRMQIPPDVKTGGFELQRGTVSMTTLEEAVLGLTGGTPATKPVFEKRIQAKLKIK